MNLRSTLLTACLSIFLLSSVSAQKLELGLWGGASLYSGDFSPKEIGVYFETLQPAGGVFIRTNINDPFSLELGLMRTRLSGEDGVTNDLASRGLNFRTDLTEFALKANWNLFRIGNKRGVQVVPYLMAGGSVFRFNPEAEFDGNFIELQPLGTEGQGATGYDAPYSLTDFAIVGGGGIKFIIKEKYTIGLEMGSRKTFTDYLDDVSNVQVNYLDVLENNGSLAAQLSNPNITEPTDNLSYVRGGEFEDWFILSGISFSFAFGEGSGVDGRGIGCPTF